MRITYTYQGGPLHGRTVHQVLLPENPEVPFLCKVVTKAGRGDTLKEEGGDMEAQGKYYLEKKLVVPNLTLPEEEQERKRIEDIIKRGTREEWVAIHVPSNDDRDWHALEKPVEPEPEKKPERPKRQLLTLPEKHQAVLKLAPHMQAIREVLERRKDGQG